MTATNRSKEERYWRWASISFAVSGVAWVVAVVAQIVALVLR